MIRKTQILTWLVILLMILNAVTIGTILYNNYREEKAETGIRIQTPQGGNVINGRFFRQELGFDAAQMEVFREANQQFRPVTMGLTFQIDSLKEEMFRLLRQVSPDTLQLNRLSVRIGEMHGRLKAETFRFYIRVKAVCTPPQVQKLEQVFRPLFSNEGLSVPAGLYHQGPGHNQNRGIRK
ncbi:MAG: periplasmic heavy metal sensor [Sphingobacteriales bacterium]|nr:periplasmic heavy metal sensor [Sphingobacteriales bacterium]